MNEHSHTTAPDAIPALLLYADDLSPALAYVLHNDAGTRGRWELTALDPDILPNLTWPSAAQPINVDAGADLRKAEPGAITTVTTMGGAS